MELRVITYNIHKGRGRFRDPVAMGALGKVLAERRPDILLCQEVFHAHADNGALQSSELAEALRIGMVYEPNAVYDHGHHGNATFTRLPVVTSLRRDVSTNRFEKRGLLYTLLMGPRGPIHVINAHLGLNRWQRRAQVRRIAELIRALAADDRPLILAGDFNDWTGRLDRWVQSLCGLRSILDALDRRQRRSFPAAFPVFGLDRVYFRGVELIEAGVLRTPEWSRLSDHLPVEAIFEPA